MPLVYSSVSRGQVTLAEYAALAGNFSQVAKDLLARNGAAEGKFSFNLDGHSFNFVTKEGLSKSLVVAYIYYALNVVPYDGKPTRPQRAP
jgi:vesicle-associated membrane protein 72